MRITLWIFLILCFTIYGYAQNESDLDTASVAQQKERKKVLILISFRPTLPVAGQWDRGIHSVFKTEKELEIDTNIEYLDRSNFDDIKHIQILRDLYRHKYSNPKPDLIIPVLNESLDLILKHGGDLFPDVPVVFGGVESQFIATRPLRANFTGYLTDIDYTGTLELALHLHPNTRNIVVVAGAGPIVQRWSSSCREAYRIYEDRIDITYLTGLPMKELLQKMKTLPPQTVVITFPVLIDGAGEKFIGNEAIAQICEASVAPVYTFWDVSLGTGIVGGYMSSFEKEAQVVAKLGIRVLKGENPANIQVIKAPKYAYMFDWRQLKYWSIPESMLPQSSIIKFQEYTLWDLYWGRIIGIIVLVLIQATTIFYLLFLRRRRLQIEKFSSEQLAFEQLLTKMSSDFSRLPADQTDSRIHNSLSLIGKFLGADRAFLFRFNWDRTQYSISHLWESKETDIDQNVRGSIVRELFPWLHKKLINDQDVIVADSDKLCFPETMAEYKYCQQIGIQSFIVLPVQVANSPLCAIGLDSILTKNAFPKEIRDHLRLIGEIFANAIERQQSELQLRETERKYRTVADYTFDWEYWQNPDGSFQWMSPSCEQICGYTTDKFMKTSSLLMDIIVPEDKKKWDKHHCESQRVKKANEIKFRIKRADGEIRWIEHSCKPILDEKGTSKGVRANNRDITSRELFRSETHLLRNELIHIERIGTISALTSTLAHEVNQPLAAIQSYAQAALRFMDKEQPEYDNVYKALQGIVSDNKRAAAVINRLRDLVKKGEIRTEQFSLNTSINDVISIMSSEFILRNTKLKLDLNPRDLKVQGDTIQIQQVILNLLSNALDAIEDLPVEKSVISIATGYRDSDETLLTVSDPGPGIPPEKINSIFAPFHTTKSEGVGLGLAICKSIIDSHGGKIWAENNPDSGATFSFTLPTGEK